MRSQILRGLAAAIFFGASGGFGGAIYGGETLCNNDVALMIESGLSEEIIREKIASTDNFFEMSASAMIELQNRRVPESLIQLMHQESLKTAKKFRARVLSELRKFAGGDEEIRRAARLYLKKNRDAAVPQIRDALASPQSDIRRAAAEILGNFDDRQSVALFRELLIDSDAKTRRIAADTLAKFDDREAVEIAKKSLRQESALPRSGYVRLLGAAKDIAGVDLVARRLLKDADAETRAEAAEALGELNAGSAVATLTNALRYETDKNVRVAVVVSLGKIAAPEKFPLLAETCRTSPSLRLAALSAIARYPAKESVPFLIEALEQPLRPEEKSAVTAALRELTDRDFGDTYGAWEQFLALFKAENAFADYAVPVKSLPEKLLSSIDSAGAPPAVESITEDNYLGDLEKIYLPTAP